jgi:hypothetical protein
MDPPKISLFNSKLEQILATSLREERENKKRERERERGEERDFGIVTIH